MRVTGLITNLPVTDVDATRDFYVDYLGLHDEKLGLGWLERHVSADGASVQLVTRDATSPVNSVMSIQVGDDVDEAYAEAKRRGNVVNINSHKDA
jgi:hypothetical protein